MSKKKKNQRKNINKKPEPVLTKKTMNLKNIADDDLINIKTTNILKHLSAEEIQELGPMTSVNLTRGNTFVVVTFEKSYVLVFTLTHDQDYDADEYTIAPLQKYGPFGPAS